MMQEPARKRREATVPVEAEGDNGDGVGGSGSGEGSSEGEGEGSANSADDMEVSLASVSDDNGAGEDVEMAPEGAPSAAAAANDDGPRAPRGRNNARLSQKEELFLLLVILRVGMTFEQDGAMWKMGHVTVTRIFIQWLLHVHLVFRVFFPSPDRATVEVTCPEVMVKQFGHKIGYFLDACEVQIAVPTDPDAQKATWSDYKQRNTVKLLGLLASCGTFVWFSDAYPGSITDDALCLVSGLLGDGALVKGSTVVADKGFRIFYALGSKGVRLWTPPKRKKGQQGTSEAETRVTSSIANQRIHVERGFRQIRVFK